MSNVGKYIIDWWIGSPCILKIETDTTKQMKAREIGDGAFRYKRTIRKSANPIIIDTLEEAEARIKAIQPIVEELKELENAYRASREKLTERRNAILRGEAK